MIIDGVLICSRASMQEVIHRLVEWSGGRHWASHMSTNNIDWNRMIRAFPRQLATPIPVDEVDDDSDDDEEEDEQPLFEDEDIEAVSPPPSSGPVIDYSINPLPPRDTWINTVSGRGICTLTNHSSSGIRPV